MTVIRAIILVNAILFGIVTIQSGTLMSPGGSALFSWGAKDGFRMTLGEYWRYFTPIFLHIGAIHFLVNNYSLYVLGPHTERIFGARRFLIIYLVAGISGNIASACYQPYPSAGASGALFGIMGASFWFEWTLSRSKDPMLARASMVKSFVPVILANLALGFLVPMIDQAAHIGGLTSGIIMSDIYLNLTNNPLKYGSRVKAQLLALGLFATMLLGIYVSTSGGFWLNISR